MKRAHCVDAHQIGDGDGERDRLFFGVGTWVATDSAGRQFGGETEEEAREMCETYNAPKRRSTKETP